MNRPSIKAIVESYLPILVQAGDYAARIQSRVQRPAQKSGQNEWTQALTDADLTVQTFVEVFTLGRYPALGFFGEESEQSINQKYFPTDTEIVVHLDPINGTFLYQNQKPGWDIILSIAEQGQLAAAISYMPVRGRFYLAIRGIGARTGDRNTLSLDAMEPLQAVDGSRLCMTYRAPDVLECLGTGFEGFDIVDDYDPDRAVDNLNDLFTGRLEAFACRDGDMLDWGAMAFIVAAAGGRATHLDGSAITELDQFDPLHATDMLVSTSPTVHEELLQLLK
jgi:myo-inositol-1(or 4)-monophosphatase